VPAIVEGVPIKNLVLSDSFPNRVTNPRNPEALGGTRADVSKPKDMTAESLAVGGEHVDGTRGVGVGSESDLMRTLGSECATGYYINYLLTFAPFAILIPVMG
jgi:hypothetical protein